MNALKALLAVAVCLGLLTGCPRKHRVGHLRPPKCPVSLVVPSGAMASPTTAQA